mmetsp:Transcript_21909/g.70537  ORF Transcript_21909/g.70537 Transcript_21909/m.70537 type:complete len:286 (+) Transcript_21909:103-960(+)
MSSAVRYELTTVRELAPEFAEQLRVMLSKEAATMVTPEQIYVHNPSWRGHWRQILVEWLAECGDDYDICPISVEMAANYVDRVLALRAVSKDDLQLYGAAAILVACKAREYRVFRIAQLVDMTDDMYTPQQFRDAERAILETLHWRLLPVTPRQLIPYFAQLMPIPPQRVSEVEAWGRYIAANAYTRVDFLTTPPSLIVVAALDMAAKERNVPLIGHSPSLLAELEAHEDMPRCKEQLAVLREQLRERDRRKAERHGSPHAVSAADSGSGSGAPGSEAQDPSSSK